MLDMTEDRERDRDRNNRRGGGDNRRGGGRDDSRDRSRDRQNSRRIYVSNIPYEYRWQDLKDLFRKEVGDVAFVELFSDENNKPRGCGIVEFDKAESVQKALEKMNRYELNGRNLVVKEDFGNERDKYGRVLPKGVGRDRDDNRGGGGGGGGGRYRDMDDRLLVSISLCCNKRWSDGFSLDISSSFIYPQLFCPLQTLTSHPLLNCSVNPR